MVFLFLSGTTLSRISGYMSTFIRARSFQGTLIGSELPLADDEGEPIFIFTDIGQDNDDEMAFLLISELMRRGEVKVVGVVANGHPANRRAALARGTLDILDMSDVPVGIGTDGGSTKTTDEFSKLICEGFTGIDYFRDPWERVKRVEAAIGTEEEDATSGICNIYDGQKLLVSKLEEAEDESLNLVVLSSLKDVAMLLRSHESLFQLKVKCVTIMGGMQIPESMAEPPSCAPPSRTVRLSQRGNVGMNGVEVAMPYRTSLQALFKDVPVHPSPQATFQRVPEPAERNPVLVPDDGCNNISDIESSKFFYRRCQEIGVQLIVLSRHTAYGCPFQKFVYDLMVRCPIPHPTVCRLQRAQRVSIEALWQQVCAGDTLPARCTKKWFCDTFCEGLGTERGSGDSMWDLVVYFNMYDPLAILAAIPNRRNLFFQPIQHVGPDGTVHLNIGENKLSTGIIPNKVDDLHDFLMTTWISAAGRVRKKHSRVGFDGFVERPLELDQEQSSEALVPLKTHTPEDLEVLNANVLTLLDVEWPKLKNSSLLSTWKDRDMLMRSIGPEMQLVDPETVALLGRIPHSAEGKTITMEEAASRAAKDGLRFFIEMFSHRWHSPFAPDDRFCNKARVLCEWAKYRRSMNFRTFYWIDHACIDQNNIAPGVAMLPLYVSCTNNILCYDVPEYEKRAWCRVERLLFTAFVAPNNEYVAPDFEHKTSSEKLPNGDLKPMFDGKVNVPDPSAADAELSYQSDCSLIIQLKDLCDQHWAKCWKDGLMGMVEKNGLKNARNLRYGETEVRMRRFT